MDPYNEVKQDAWSTIAVLEDLVRSNGDPVEFANNFEEFQEIQHDLHQAVEVSEANPQRFGGQAVVEARRQELEDLVQRGRELQSQFNAKSRQSPNTPANRHVPREVTTMSNRISQDENPFSLQSQQQIHQQDAQLDSIHETMRNLNKQASLMGNELEEQGFMLDELDAELDHTESRLSRGMKRINDVIERNKNNGSDWCIGILAVALCVLLVLVIAL